MHVVGCRDNSVHFKALETNGSLFLFIPNNVATKEAAQKEYTSFKSLIERVFMTGVSAEEKSFVTGFLLVLFCCLCLHHHLHRDSSVEPSKYKQQSTT